MSHIQKVEHKEPTIECMMQTPRFMEGDVELKIVDKNKVVWSSRDGDDIWGTALQYEDAVKLLGKEKVDKFIETSEACVVSVPESFWTNEKGYSIRRNRPYTPGKPATVVIPIDTADTLTNVPCPYCGYPKEIELDGRGEITCEGCGNPYKLVSQI